MDRVGQALFRTTCQDGFQAGFEAGLKAARPTSRPKPEGLARQLADQVADHLSELGQDLKDCNEVAFFYSLAFLASLRDTNQPGVTAD